MTGIVKVRVQTVAAAIAIAMTQAAAGVAAERELELEGFSDPVLHEKHHHIYKNLHNQEGTHCCPVGDCRPTSAKFVDGQWYAKLNGVWEKMESKWFVMEYKYSWSETAHVCAGPAGFIYCFVRPGAQG